MKQFNSIFLLSNHCCYPFSRSVDEDQANGFRYLSDLFHVMYFCADGPTRKLTDIAQENTMIW